MSAARRSEGAQLPLGDSAQREGSNVNVLPAAWRKKRVAVLLAAAALLVFALLLPDIQLTRPVAQVVVVLDVSQSMNTQDCRLDHTLAAVSRLACVKDALAEALREMPCGASSRGASLQATRRSCSRLPSRSARIAVTCSIRSRNSTGASAGKRAAGSAAHWFQRCGYYPWFRTSRSGARAGLHHRWHEAPPVALRNRRHFEDYLARCKV